MRRFLNSIPVVVAFLLANMGCTDSVAPGYSGPIVSSKGQKVARGLAGASFTDKDGNLGGGEWTIVSFAVVPNPRTGKGPVVEIRKGTRVEYLPMESDGDVIDLYRRVHDSPPEGLSGDMSQAYRSVWERKKK